MRVAVETIDNQGNKRIVSSAGFRDGDWPLGVDEENLPCTCGYTGQGTFIAGFPICNSKNVVSGLWEKLAQRREICGNYWSGISQPLLKNGKNFFGAPTQNLLKTPFRDS